MKFDDLLWSGEMIRFISVFFLTIMASFLTPSWMVSADTTEFWEKFEATVYVSSSEEIKLVESENLHLQVIGSENAGFVDDISDKMSSALDVKIMRNNEIHDSTLSNRFLIIFSNNFSDTVRWRFGGHFLAIFPYIYVRKDRKEILNKAFVRGCFFASSLVSVNKKEKKLYSTLLVNSEQPLEIQKKCVLYNFLMIGGFSNIAFDQIEQFLVEKSGKVHISDFTYQALSLIARSNLDEQLSKSKMKKFVLTNYPLGKSGESLK